MCSSACERMGSAQISFSTVVAALAQSKLAAPAPKAGTARQAASKRTLRTRRGSRVRGASATDSMWMVEAEVPVAHPERAGTPPTLIDDGAGRTSPPRKRPLRPRQCDGALMN